MKKTYKNKFTPESLARIKAGASRGGKKTVAQRSPEEWKIHLEKMITNRLNNKRK